MKASLGEMVELVIWRRKEPDPALLSMIEMGTAALLYPKTEMAEKEQSHINTLDSCFDFFSDKRFNTFVILDATWQQARKMYNQSTYLKSMPKISLDAAPNSSYQLRRNQREGGLCTAECVVELLKQEQQFVHAQKLQNEFELMNSVQ